MRRMLLLVTVAAMTAALVALAGVASATPGSTDPDFSKKLAEVRQATAKYNDEGKAPADGYVRTDHCIAVPGLGGMGYHYVNPALIGPPSDKPSVALSVDPLKPQVLLYAPKNGERKLVAVEYLVVDHDQDLETNGDRPSLFGVPFDGPMPGHEPGMPVHYDLHMWAWEDNPNGIFAQFNPNVRC